jgi:hypothetical protein
MEERTYVVWCLLLFKLVKQKLKYIVNLLIEKLLFKITFLMRKQNTTQKSYFTMFVSDLHRILGFVKRTTERHVLSLSQWNLWQTRCFFRGPERWKSLGVQSGLNGVCARHCQAGWYPSGCLGFQHQVTIFLAFWRSLFEVTDAKLMQKCKTVTRSVSVHKA